MQIKKKLLLVLAVPACCVCLFAWNLYSESRQVNKTSRKIESLVSLSVAIGNLLHETQQERGMSAGFIGSSGKKFASDIKQQHDETNARFADFRSTLTRVSIESPILSDLLARFDQLPKIRSQILNHQLPVKQAIGFYTTTNQLLIDTIAEQAFSVSDGNLQRSLNAYLHLLKGKERSGIERAVLSNAFAKDAFAEGGFQTYRFLVNIQDTYFGEFKQCATHPMLESFAAAENSEATRDVERFRQTVDANPEGGFNQSSSDWFAAKTKQINLYKATEDFVADLIAQEARTNSAAASRASWTTLLLSLLGMALTGGGAAWIYRDLRNGFSGLVDRIRDIAEADADLRKRLPETKDEFGDVGHWFNLFAGRLQGLVTELRQNSQNLNSSASELASTAETLTDGVKNAKESTTAISHNSEEMSTNIQQLDDTCRGITDNVQTVASGVGDIANVISEISTNAEQAAKTADNVSAIVDTSNDKINQLSTVAAGIGRVIDVIQDIAEQTNLLALNATIEAARAGEAGKGFSVVATEVKELAQQTSQATVEIRKQVESIQSAADDSVTSIREISEAVTEVNESARNIASAVDEQSTATQHVSNSAQETAMAISTLTSNLSEAVAASSAISKGLASVDTVISETAAAAEQTGSSSSSLQSMANNLDSLVVEFSV